MSRSIDDCSNWAQNDTISSQWEIAALVEVVERKAVLKRQELNDLILELRKRQPEATTLEQPAGNPIQQPNQVSVITSLSTYEVVY